MPIVDKALQQRRFGEFNQPAIDRQEIRRTLEEGRERIGRFFVGQSTGTSGNKGVYVISEHERMMWLGTILAKTIPKAMFRRTRVAIALPGFSALYSSATTGSRVRLAYFDLSQPLSAWRDTFRLFMPSVVVAPPRVLRGLADVGLLGDVEAFSAAEVLDPIDRSIIESATGRPLREIYMATEGLLGVSCRHGTLHLAEDVVRFEWEYTPDGRLANPIVTDLVRRVQPMIRYRMNDLLELANGTCPCGSAFLTVSRIHGRVDDAFEFARNDVTVIVTPDILRNAVVDAHDAINDFRIVQRLDGSITVSLDAAVPDAAHAAARDSLTKVLDRFGVAARIISIVGLTPRLDQKLRRVERERD